MVSTVMGDALERLGSRYISSRSVNLASELLGRLPSTTAAFLAIADVLADEFEDHKGAAMVREFAHTFALHEVDTI